MLPSGDRVSDLTRRRILQTTGSLTALAVLGNSASLPVAADPGTEQWAFETGSLIFASPTVVDGTVYVGSADDNLYALDAGVEGSSEGSRVQLGTLGHHGEWQYADQSIPVTEESERSESVPGFGVGSGITALGATGYMLKRRLENN